MDIQSAKFLERAAALEAPSKHPIAQAIVKEAEDRGIIFKRAETFEMVEGKGALWNDWKDDGIGSVVTVLCTR